MVRIAVFLLAAMVAFPQVADAKNYLFRFRNTSGSPLQVQLYADSRDNIWPSANETWVYPADGRIYVNGISCHRGEMICFGAWIEGRSDFYWGTGRGKQNRCDSCCYRCSGQQTEIINLNPPDLSLHD